MEVRWGLDELPRLLGQLRIEQPFLVASDRWSQHALPIRPAGRWSEVPSDRIDAVVESARAADGVVALGGGSAIDLAKAVSAETRLPLVSVPTTYSGSEWTRFYGIRDPQRRARGGGGGATLAGIVYEPELTIALPRAETVGTAANALAHSAEALYVAGRSENADREALAGAGLISEWLPRVVASPNDAEARRRLLEGASHAGAALGSAGLGLGHAMAQALGGRYGAPHGALNAIVLPAALRFNEPVAAAEIGRF
ncbi:MAG TPA: iron-containing alcohol dehydrogenase, partial [Gaiellaceae bacterium]|nr:iron-containing alcohol dehydrogenase [Gaiellaceae bacterium]